MALARATSGKLGKGRFHMRRNWKKHEKVQRKRTVPACLPPVPVKNVFQPPPEYNNIDEEVKELVKKVRKIDIIQVVTSTKLIS